MKFYLSKFSILSVVALLVLNGCEGYAKAGMERTKTTIGDEVTKTEDIIYAEVGGKFIVQNGFTTSQSNSALDPTTWELELDSSFGLTTSIKNNQATVTAINGNSIVAQRNFSLIVQNNKARFSQPSAVENWLMTNQFSADKFRAEVQTVTENPYENDGQVTAKWKEQSQVKAQVSYSVAGTGSCGPGRDPSKVIEIC